MKLKSNFITHDVQGSQMMVAVNDDFHGLTRNNETAAFIVNLLKKETTLEDIVSELTKEYDVDKETALKDVQNIIDVLKNIGAIE